MARHFDWSVGVAEQWLATQMDPLFHGSPQTVGPVLHCFRLTGPTFVVALAFAREDEELMLEAGMLGSVPRNLSVSCCRH